MQKGDRVHFTRGSGKTQNGIVKSVTQSGDTAFVVYNCNGNWDNYENYTAISTNIDDLIEGWIEVEPENYGQSMQTTTKLEYFTAMAMQGLLANSTQMNTTDLDWLALHAVQYAKATLKELKND